MSDEDPTTKPTMETVLDMLRELREEMRAGFAAVSKRFDAVDVRLDRIDSEIKKTQSDFHGLRADFNEFKAEVREHFPAVK
jgi:hypothetical protein